ncbi:transcriptional regulator, AraC family [Desulfarculus baarsii DSM 2075]|uniref:Transcriptional regulator, AraC family n=1 Tax=Desulfarculus baarsii (strain ATCC 33931 / DSM 2075 / LMG 7858 / VKM B-1802 / 2st14) TaxID=644282 RepID=E1QIS0_DESB2|nr:AraC family transcriptional regulator [Desulfarculus baarsii]ADK84493.1 transcriptional regulator, AraC family [Desulfarculus baarsii DSM 2075]
MGGEAKGLVRRGEESSLAGLEESGVPAGVEGQLMEVKPGLRVAAVDCRPQDDLRIEFETGEAPLEFSYYLAGRARYLIDHERGEHAFVSEAGLNTVAAFPRSRAVMEIPAGVNARMVAIHIEAHVIADHLAERPNAVVPELAHAAENGVFPYCFRPSTMPPSMAIVANQILSCPYHGAVRRLFYESKTLELMALQLSQLLASHRPTAHAPLNRQESGRIQAARNILLDDLQNPPSLFQLAGAVGMTHTKLNKGFRDVFGTTVFDYLRRQRLEQSRLMIDADEMNMAEIAYATGFSSPSHFAKAFLAYFGVQPSAYLKEAKGRRGVRPR